MALPQTHNNLIALPRADLRNLLGERVSIRDLPAILEGIAEAVGHTKNALYITEHVRARLARQLCHANLS
ncbi:MAG TPA: FHIPEP family type III secretion protein, partial [Rhizomicrobium sp.]|nr:FHIPEP family type III secretion protein [Rhizomicrobium sp.]